MQFQLPKRIITVIRPQIDFYVFNKKALKKKRKEKRVLDL